MMILTVEHTSGEHPCHECGKERDRTTGLNLKESFPRENPRRIRLCGDCVFRLYKDLERALIFTGGI